MADVCAGLEVDAARMRANLDETRGLIMAEGVMMALGAKIGRLAAHDLIEEACHRAVAEKRHLRDVLSEEAKVTAHLDVAALDCLRSEEHPSELQSLLRHSSVAFCFTQTIT